MDRYVAFLWGRRSDGASRQAEQWAETILRRGDWISAGHWPGMRILVRAGSSGKAPFAPLEGLDGVVVGSIFRRGEEMDGALRRLTGPSALRVAESGGAELISNYWGSYIAIWRETETGATQVMRDPCGALSCFRSRLHEIDILCSFLADVADLPGFVASIDWNAVRAFLLDSHAITPFTGLREVLELLPGQRLTWRPDGAAAFTWMWSATDLASTPTRKSSKDREAELRSTAEACFTAWGATSNSILIRLSGGLDSSIVASLARRTSSAKLTAVHLIGSGYEAFELKLARLAAQRAGIDLIELEVDHSLTMAATHGLKLARPTRQLLGGAADAVLNDACSAAGADTIMAGHGGDSLFLQRAIAGDALADYVRLNGAGADFWKVAYETAVLTERPVFSVLAEAAAYALGAKRWDPFASFKQSTANWAGILGPDAPASLPQAYLEHPRLDDARHLPPCKAEQIRSIIALRNYHPVCGHGLDHRAVHPFISQPIVEQSLLTPAYEFSRGGADRSLERRAFADLLPAEIVRREQKGFINHNLSSALAKDIAGFRDAVVHGALAAHRLIDRDHVAKRFSEDQLNEGANIGALLDLIAAETWLKAWI